MALSDAVPKLKLLIPRLATDNEGELASTVFAIQRILKSNNTDFHDLAASIGGGASSKTRQEPPKQERAKPKHDYSKAEPEPNWDAILEFCLARQRSLGSREVEFVNDMVDNLAEWGSPTEKQGNWLRRIYAKLGGTE